LAPPGRPIHKVFGMSDLGKQSQDLGIKYFLVSFVDLFGVLRSKLVPAKAIAGCQKSGAGFAGFAAYFALGPEKADVLAYPDPTSLVQVPWDTQMGWLCSDLTIGGETMLQAPRTVLKNALEKMKQEKGWTLKIGVECEFFLMDKQDTSKISDNMDLADKPCYDQCALMRKSGILCQLVDYMEILGWKPYQCDHEDANGQFEINWEFDDALVTADREVFFKYMVKSLAESHGCRATFMPKPFQNRTGTGGHMHITVHDANTGKNLFDDGNGDLSELAKQFLAGVLSHGSGLCAVHNPTISSYKRLNSSTTASGCTWAPKAFSWGGNDRTVAVRVPDAPRFELRMPDLAANPYLAFASLLAAGLDGVDKKMELGPKGEGPPIPMNLLDALRAFDADPVLKSGLGDECSKAYHDLKMEHEVAAHANHISKWELDHTLDC